MADIGPINPPMKQEQLFGAAPPSMKEELYNQVEQIYKEVVFATDPNIPAQKERLTGIAQLTSTILWTCKNWEFDPKTEKDILNMATNLHANMNWQDIEKELQNILSYLKGVDKKVGAIHYLMQAEHIFCIAPKNPIINSEDFQKIVEPIIHSLRYEMTSFDVTKLENHLNSIIKSAVAHPNNLKSLLEELKKISDSLNR